MVSAAGMLSLLVAGTFLTPIQSYAAPQETTNDGGFLDSPNLKQGVHDEIRADLKNTNQSINQENLCFRSNTCRQSEIGQNTLGNDNSVTGFADQSDNIQQTTTANTTTPIPTPTGTTATLTVTKVVSGNTTAIPAQFAIHVTGNNPNPPNFAGSTTGIDVTLGSGAFNVTETAPTGSLLTSSFIGDCAGTIAAGQHLSCTIVNTPLTCEQCFAKFLTTAQITAFLQNPLVNQSSIADLCKFRVFSESALRTVLGDIGLSLITTTELINCLKDAGVVFVP
jgi:hypothetical protein